MEIDPLKIPAFMRQKSVSTKSAVITTPVVRPAASRPVIKIQPSRFVSSFLEMLEADIAKKKPKRELMLTPVGQVTHYYDKIGVAVIKLIVPLTVGMHLQLIGEKGPFKQKLDSMQINRAPVFAAGPGDDIGIKVKKPTILGKIAHMIQS